jgi:hypothetical protein
MVPGHKVTRRPSWLAHHFSVLSLWVYVAYPALILWVISGPGVQRVTKGVHLYLEYHYPRPHDLKGHELFLSKHLSGWPRYLTTWLWVVALLPLCCMPGGFSTYAMSLCWSCLRLSPLRYWYTSLISSLSLCSTKGDTAGCRVAFGKRRAAEFEFKLTYKLSSICVQGARYDNNNII